jgi:hypothetical protein
MSKTLVTMFVLFVYSISLVSLTMLYQHGWPAKDTAIAFGYLVSSLGSLLLLFFWRPDNVVTTTRPQTHPRVATKLE